MFIKKNSAKTFICRSFSFVFNIGALKKLSRSKKCNKKVNISLELVKIPQRLGLEPRTYCNLEIMSLTH